jgi:hypothetical protein
VMAVPQDRKGSDPRSYLWKTLYRCRYLVPRRCSGGGCWADRFWVFHRLEPN